MSFADKLFIKTCENILTNGSSTEGQQVRPHWEDGSLAHTLKVFGVVNQYDLRKEFPAITLRRTALKSAMDEILWIYQKKSNNIHDLNSHIWDAWADEGGSIGKAYGYQVRQPVISHDEIYTPEYILSHKQEFPDNTIEQLQYTMKHSPNDSKIEIKRSVWVDQMNYILNELKVNPFSRRLMISLWNVKDLNEMNLQPCCWSINFNVSDEGMDKLVLNMVLHQRSSDVLTANNWNVSQYAILLMMVAQVSGMIPGTLLHVIADAHIYDRHVPIVKELITRPQYSAPKVTLNPDIRDFYDFKTDDLIVENYNYTKFDQTIPVAV